MRIDKKDLFDNLELYLGGIFAIVTVSIVIMNVFTRYCLGFTFFWTEEIAVGCFVWTIFLGSAGAFRQKKLMGVDILIQIAKGKPKKVIELISSICLFVVSTGMFFMSCLYIKKSNKVTAALEISYRFITVSIVIAFFLMSIYALCFLIKEIKNFNKVDSVENKTEVGAN